MQENQDKNEPLTWEGRPLSEQVLNDPKLKKALFENKPLEYKPNKKLTIILFTLFIITSIASVLITNYYAKRYRESVKSKDLLLHPTGSIKQVENVSKEETQWQIYTNHNYAYSIEYPSDWEVAEATPISGIPNEPTWEGSILQEGELHKVSFLEKQPKTFQGLFQIKILSNPQNLTQEDWAKNYKVPLLADPNINLAQVVGKTSLNGLSAEVLSINTLDVPSMKAIATLHKNNIYFLTFEDWESILEEELRKEYNADRLTDINNQILSTFKFTEGGSQIDL